MTGSCEKIKIGVYLIFLIWIATKLNLKIQIFVDQGRTAVTISHRLPSIVTSDMIYVIQKGQVLTMTTIT